MNTSMHAGHHLPYDLSFTLYPGYTTVMIAAGLEHVSGTNCVEAACSGKWRWVDGELLTYDSNWMPSAFYLRGTGGSTYSCTRWWLSGTTWYLDRGHCTTQQAQVICKVESCHPLEGLA